MRLLKYALVIILSFLATLGNGQISNLHYAQMSMVTGDYTSAIEHLTNYIQARPDEAIGYLKRAKAYGATGQFDLQKRDQEAAAKINKVKTDMFFNKNYRSNIIAKKVYKYSMSDSLFNKSPIRFYDYQDGLISSELKDNQLMVINSILSSAIEYDMYAVKELTRNESFKGVPDYIKSDMLGLYELKIGNVDNAIALFQESIHKNEAYAMAHHNLAISHFIQANNDLAINAIQSAININPNIPLFYYSKAKMKEIKDPSTALEYYQKAIDLDDNYSEALLDYALLLKSLGEYSRGSVFLNMGSRGVLNIQEKRFIDGSIFIVEGDYFSAINKFDEFLSVNPDDGDALFNRGLAHILVANYNAGCKDLDESRNSTVDENRLELINRLCFNFDTSIGN